MKTELSKGSSWAVTANLQRNVKVWYSQDSISAERVNFIFTCLYFSSLPLLFLLLLNICFYAQFWKYFGTFCFRKKVDLPPCRQHFLEIVLEISTPSPTRYRSARSCLLRLRANGLKWTFLPLILAQASMVNIDIFW